MLVDLSKRLGTGAYLRHSVQLRKVLPVAVGALLSRTYRYLIGQDAIARVPMVATGERCPIPRAPQSNEKLQGHDAISMNLNKNIRETYDDM